MYTLHITLQDHDNKNNQEPDSIGYKSSRRGVNQSMFVCMKSYRAVNKGPVVRIRRAEEAASAICHLLASWHRVQPGELSGPWLGMAA